MTQKELTALLLLICFAAAVPAGAQAVAPNFEESVDAYLRPYLDIGHLSGTILIARGDEVLYEKSFGLANRELGVPNGPRTKFCIGSVNKPMTLVILARLIELEELAPEDTLDKYFPGFPRGGEITVGHLARGTKRGSGIA